MVITLLIFLVLVGFLAGDVIVHCRRSWAAIQGRDWHSLPKPMNTYAASVLWFVAGIIWLIGLHQSAG